ncbi:MAG: rod shape-determining protein RodA [Elusimicrobiota bacterium]|nr:rod shape-determining protein RodA [Elusimicrobiota bacterium]
MKKLRKFLATFIFNIDWIILLIVFTLATIGIFAIDSASSFYETSFKHVSVQIAACFLGTIFLFAIAAFDYQFYKYLDKIIYAISISLLISVLIFGTLKKGTRGWFNLGYLSFQPVEIVKICYILVLSSFLDKNSNNPNLIYLLTGTFLILFGHLVLIMLQPDFSSTLSYFPVTLVLLFIAGVPTFILMCLSVFASFAVGMPLLETFAKMQQQVFPDHSFMAKIHSLLSEDWYKIYILEGFSVIVMSFWWGLKKLKISFSFIYPFFLCLSIAFGCLASIVVDKSLKDYQRKRLVVFLNPKVDVKGAGYNIIQSKIAIGSGEFKGKGFKQGTQTQLGFLPEQHTDFIFSIIGEERGWIVSQLIIVLYFLFIWRIFKTAKNAKDRYGSFVAIGIGTMFTFYIVINIGMVMGMMPVTGMPLPLLSYGGSSVFSSLCAVGILCSIQIRKYLF